MTVGVFFFGMMISGIYFFSLLRGNDGGSRPRLTIESNDSNAVTDNPSTISASVSNRVEIQPSQQEASHFSEGAVEGVLSNENLPRYPGGRLQGEPFVGMPSSPYPSADQNWRPKQPIEPGKYRLGSLNDYPPDLREDAQRAFDQMKSQGYVSVDDEVVSNELVYLNNYFNYVAPMSAAEEKLAFQLDDLQGTLFDKYDAKGFIPAGDPNSKAISAARFFSDPRNGVVLKLEEWAYPLSSGGGVLMFEEGATRDVNGYPTTFTINRSPSGQAFSGLSWFTDKKSYTLFMPGDVKKDGRYEEMLALGRSVSGSQRRLSSAPASSVNGQTQPPNIVANAVPSERPRLLNVEPQHDATLNSQNTEGKTGRTPNDASTESSSVQSPHSLPPEPGRIRIIALKDYPPDMRQQMEQWIQEMKALGYIQVQEDELVGQLEYFKDYRRYVMPMSKAHEKLQIKFDRLDNTPFAQLTLVGFIPDHVEDGEKATIAKRVFVDQKDRRIFFLEERDRVSGNSTEILPKEAVTKEVNGHPTTFTIRQSPSGKAVSEVTWHAEQKSYTLVTPTNVTKTGKFQEFLAFARSVPARIPATGKSTPLKP